MYSKKAPLLKNEYMWLAVERPTVVRQRISGIRHVDPTKDLCPFPSATRHSQPSVFTNELDNVWRLLSELIG